MGTVNCPEGCGFLPGNPAALKHGARRLETTGGTALDRTERHAIERAVLEDLGGEEEVSAVLRELVGDFAFCAVLRERLAEHLAIVGPMTRKGRKRAAADMYLAASKRLERLAARIGTDRKAKPVPSLQEYLSQREAQS